MRLPEAWGADALHADWLLQRWGEWSRAGVHVRGVNSSAAFAIKTGGKDLISDKFALDIDGAICACEASTKNCITAVYLNEEFAEFPDSILIPCLKEFLDVFQKRARP